MWSARWMDGRATFTTVLSSMIMKSPKETAASVHHFLFSSAKRRAFIVASMTITLPCLFPSRSLRTVGEFVWTPSEEQVERANVTRLARMLGCDGFHELHRVSIEEPERFWPAVVADLELEFSRTWDDV